MSQVRRALMRVLKRKHDELVPLIIREQCPWEVDRLGRAQKKIRRLIRIILTNKVIK
jgi:hypothetical protein